MGHGAAWVSLRNFLELPLRLFVPEVMQQSDTAIERRLHCGRARNGKGHSAQPLGSGSIGRLGRMIRSHLGNSKPGNQSKQG